uniref:Uncharacterized protein n=1 Tax=Mastacembelus armatus TaxID=205130 RepID=A0A7N8XIE9_9TELE
MITKAVSGPVGDTRTDPQYYAGDTVRSGCGGTSLRTDPEMFRLQDVTKPNTNKQTSGFGAKYRPVPYSDHCSTTN